MPSSTPRPVNELLLEYQHYLMAYRLRYMLGEPLRPKTPQLTLGQYGLSRNERQMLARQMISRSCPPGTLARLDALTDTLMFGFWHNPAQVADFIRAAIRQGGHPALEQPALFATLLSHTERARLGAAGVRQVVRHYYACLALAALYTSPHGFDEAWSKIEAEPVPLFADELQAAGLPGSGRTLGESWEEPF